MPETDANAARHERVLIYAPFGRDAQLMLDVLAAAGVCGTICDSITQFCTEITVGTGAGVIAGEAMLPDELWDLADALAAQPSWSDVPLIILLHGRNAAASQVPLLAALSKVGNLNLLERPLSIDTLLNAVHLALRARRRQYEARAHMCQLEKTKEGLAEARNEAVQANQAKSRFLAAASHDLRQPFQAMLLYHQIVADALQGTSAWPAAKALGEAINSGEDLLNALLDLSTLDAGVTKVSIADIQLVDVLETVANDLGAVAAGKGLGLRVRACPATLRSDPVLLKRIVRNLTSNAIRYTERGNVLIGCRMRPQYVLIQVWDTGIGIPADKQGHIFEDFYQVNNLERNRSMGMGLGLSIVDRMARLLGHEVSVQSMEGRGSVFTVKVARVA